jgi:hypothetical protein
MYSESDYENFSNKMETTFPKMFSDRYGGFAIGPGWWPLIEELCSTIQNHIDHRKGQCQQVIIEQIKEKFGTLRFYYRGGDDFIDGAVFLAENLTSQMCEECGAPGRRTSEGWIRTLCDFHIAERETLKIKDLEKNGFKE